MIFFPTGRFLKFPSNFSVDFNTQGMSYARYYIELGPELIMDLLEDRAIDSKLNSFMTVGFFADLIEDYKYDPYDVANADPSSYSSTYTFLTLVIRNRNIPITIQLFRNSGTLEFIWATFPTIIVILILTPSLYLLYSLEENLEPKITIKVIGHQ
jgi:hypothetical protein